MASFSEERRVLRSERVLRAIALTLSLIVSVSCSAEWSSRGQLRVTVLSPETLSRSVVPDVPSTSYQITIAGPQTIGPLTTAEESIETNLEEGVWDVLVVAVDAAQVPVASGETTGIVVTSGTAIEVNVRLAPFADTGSGWIDFTVEWPATVAVSNHDVSIDGVSIVSGVTSGATWVRLETERPAGVYAISVGLETAMGVTTVTDMVHVYGNIESSASIVLVEADFDGPPAAPSDLSAAAVDQTIELAWTDNAVVEDEYYVQRSVSSGDFSEADLLGPLSANTQSYVDSAVVEDTPYYYRVFASNEHGDSDFSNEATAIVGGSVASHIIADHAVVDLYDDIPSEWIAEVKKMLLVFPGESHGRGFIYGLELLETQDSTYSLSATWSGSPESYRDDALRISRTYWTGGSWANTGGEEDFFTNEAARQMMRDNLDYMRNTQANAISAFGFGWCWDMTWLNQPGGDVDPVYGVRWAGSSSGGPEGNRIWGLDSDDFDLTENTVSLQTYLDAVDSYNAHDSGTVTFFTTGPVDRDASALSPADSEASYQRYLKNQAIRDYVDANDGVLFDYADILSWDAGVQYTETWDGHTYPTGDPDLATGGAGYNGGQGDSHISEEACLRLGKALWWMLARIAGWDGQI